MKNTTIFFAILAMVFLLGGFVFINSKENITGNVVQDPTTVREQTQKVVLSVKDYNYYPREVRVKAGTPVEISLDSSVQGCLRSFTIKDFGVSGYLKTPQDKLTFTPNKKGTFTFACAMGMGYGKLIVE
mgnify:CR=1 FL=1